MALKHFILVALAAAAHALPNAEPEPLDPNLDVGDVSPRGDEASGGNVLFARDCDYNGCTSATYSGIKAGKYCGFCKQVLGPKYDPENMYQINGKSGSKSCCDYGPTKSCKDHYKTVKPNVLVNCKNTDKGY
ncbi:hypothetical protein LQW54_011871 [Pestalotiopsis sp. IQ-011]